MKSIGSGKMIVEFFSADIELRVCKKKKRKKKEFNLYFIENL